MKRVFILIGYQLTHLCYVGWTWIAWL